MNAKTMQRRAGELAQDAALDVEAHRLDGRTDDDMRGLLDRLAILRAVAAGRVRRETYDADVDQLRGGYRQSQRTVLVLSPDGVGNG